MRSFLYSLYRLSTALKFWVLRRILPTGRGALIAAVISATMLMGSPITPLYQLFAVALGLCSVSLVWTWCRRARLSGTRLLPSQAAVGLPLRYDVLVTNHGRTVPHWALQESLQDPRPSLTQFASAKEPGESHRNRFDRAMGFHRWQWLVHQNQMFHGGLSAPQATLSRHSTAHVSLTITPHKRGRLILDDMRVLLPDPFRLFQRACRIDAPHDSLIVLPRRYPCSSFFLTNLSQQLHDGEFSVSQKKGQNGEFASLRDYRRGDPLRLIHQKSWARLGRPVVVEVEEWHRPRFALVLDGFAAAAESDFEIAVSIAASIISDIPSSDADIDRLFLGNPKVVTASPQQQDGPLPFLEALAIAEVLPHENFPLLREAIARQAAEVSGMLVIFTGWSDSRAQFLQDLQALGIHAIALSVAAPTVPLPDDVHRIRPHQAAEDLCHVVPKIHH